MQLCSCSLCLTAIRCAESLLQRMRFRLFLHIFSLRSLSVCSLSHSCNLPKPFNRFRWHLAGNTCRVQWSTVVLDTQEKGIFGKLSPPAKTCNCKLQLYRQSYAVTWRIKTRNCWTTIPSFAKLLWSLLSSSWTQIDKTSTFFISCALRLC